MTPNYSSFFSFSSPIVYPPRYYHIYLCKSDHMVPLLKLLRWLSFFLASMIPSWRSNPNSLAWCALRGLAPAFFFWFHFTLYPLPETRTNYSLLLNTQKAFTSLRVCSHHSPCLECQSLLHEHILQALPVPLPHSPHHPGNDLLNVLLETARVCAVHCLSSGLT